MGNTQCCTINENLQNSRFYDQFSNFNQKNKIEQQIQNQTLKIPLQNFYEQEEELKKSGQYCILSFKDNQQIRLPLLISNDNKQFIDISALYQQSGYFTYDPGFGNTGSCKSSITLSDWEQNKILYRGYSIKQLVNNCSFLETGYLVLYGQLPNYEALKQFEFLLVQNMCLNLKMKQQFNCFNYDAHPMSIIISSVGFLSAFYDDQFDYKIQEQRDEFTLKFFAKIPTIIAYAFRISNGQSINEPKKEYSFLKNFLYMVFNDPMEEYFVLNQQLIQTIEQIFILLIDHEQNSSTTTIRISSSTYANPVSCILSGLVSFWGSNHGGQCEQIMEMFEYIVKLKSISIYLEQLKQNNQSPPGFGHLIFNSVDPRSILMKEIFLKFIQLIDDKNDKIVQIAQQLDNEISKDSYFKNKQLKPDIFYYSSVIFYLIGVKKNQLTCLFVLPRVIGWLSQLNESCCQNIRKLMRPRQLYVGNKEKKFVEISKRKQNIQSQVILPQYYADITKLIKP